MDSQTSSQKKSIFKRWWFWVLAVVVLIAVIGATNNTQTGKSVPAQADNTGASTTTAAPTAQASAPQTLLSISGSGTKSTQKFTAAGDWDLNYSYDCSNMGMQGNFQVYIYNGDGSLSLQNSLVNELGKSGSDVEHYHAGGTYYLQVNSGCNWKINVQG